MFHLCPISSCCRFARVGSVVLALHDASDVFLEVGKMSKYGGAETLASFSFVLFVLSWVLLRLVYYPFWVLWSTRSALLLLYHLFCSLKSRYQYEDCSGYRIKLKILTL